jgi:hypothetical protein
MVGLETGRCSARHGRSYRPRPAGQRPHGHRLRQLLAQPVAALRVFTRRQISGILIPDEEDEQNHIGQPGIVALGRNSRGRAHGFITIDYSLVADRLMPPAPRSKSRCDKSPTSSIPASPWTVSRNPSLPTAGRAMTATASSAGKRSGRRRPKLQDRPALFHRLFRQPRLPRPLPGVPGRWFPPFDIKRLVQSSMGDRGQISGLRLMSKSSSFPVISIIGSSSPL